MDVALVPNAVGGPAERGGVKLGTGRVEDHERVTAVTGRVGAVAATATERVGGVGEKPRGEFG
jgi:hypothetical protein